MMYYIIVYAHYYVFVMPCFYFGQNIYSHLAKYIIADVTCLKGSVQI